MRYSRRKVLRLTGSLLAAAPVMVVAGPALAKSPDPVITPVSHSLGRSIQVGIAVREQPSTQAKLVRRLKWNEVIALKGQTLSDESPTDYNKIWYQTEDGFVYSAFIQPVEDKPNQPVTGVEGTGFWGEVSVPFTQARYTPGAAGIVYHYYYSSVFRVTAMQADKDSALWYRLSENPAGGGLWVPAEHIRPIPVAEFTPLFTQRATRRQTRGSGRGQTNRYRIRSRSGGVHGTRRHRRDFPFERWHHTELPHDPRRSPGIPESCHATHGRWDRR